MNEELTKLNQESRRLERMISSNTRMLTEEGVKRKRKKTFHLGELVTLKRGYDLPESKRTPGDYPIISSSGMSGSHNEYRVEGPGVVTGRYGTLGEVFYVANPFWPLNTTLYVHDYKGSNPRFISYYLRTVLSGNFNTAGAVPGVSRSVLHKLRRSQASARPEQNCSHPVFVRRSD